ncbi:MAG: glycosyltransferase family 2 protein [bacterium]|nr:glycosyltransferase family 2 protein [bacterium]
MKKLSVIIPVFNEEKTIVQVIEQVLAQETGEWQKEIVVVDDGSTDSTGEKLKAFSGRIKVFRHGKNLGKGAALQTGFTAATGEAVIIQDADLEYDPADWPKMLEEFERDEKLVAVYGSRELSPKRRGYFHYVLGVKFLSFLVNLLFGSHLTDVYTCYKLFRTDFLRSLKLESNGFEIEAEITCKTLRARGKIKEVPIGYFPRRFSQGKKIRVRDGLKGAFKIVKFRFR